MQLRPEIQIQSMIKAMMEVVLPAVDPSNELAVQQAQLVVGHLSIFAQRLPLQYRYDRDALDRLIALAADLKAAGAGGDSSLEQAAGIGAKVLERAKADPAELVQAARALTAAMDTSIRKVFAEGDEATQSRVEKVTLAMGREQLLRDRAWLIMQGWEPDPASVPAIDTLLAPTPAQG
ncbi:MAG: hypothetical protein M0P39_07835 [Rhodocyclaceae bacterium]|nr:hypothetical protein [Rhodocyclaceae bacterium]